ncbi:zinc-dependent metalloprotease [Corynebacterium sp. CNCTC7651]|uniref:zinc-dependent metalloprotease n=1 Tax=Corynebacterium sp. CNCTC7651 TaxID=2815361 RepID=UPI001F2D0700|nr:zinc-dependent metalloprotease [Corynebacterium sp. CNCTC7651]UIZ92642.1 zinc-dependent metalloprotease [Corynebacterium sp. CNCTC7651]
MSNGFGFSFPSDDRDDDRDRDRDRDRRDGDGGTNPFAAFGFGGANMPNDGGLGDVLNQFGQMLSGMGSSMNAQSAGDAVNFDMALRIARQRVGGTRSISAGDKKAVEESVKLADLWLDEATTLPAASAAATAWNADEWLSGTMSMWKRLVNPVADHMNRAQLDTMPAEAREMMGPMSGMMRQMNSMQFGMKLGHALGDLAQQALTGTDFGLPVAPRGVTAVLPSNVTAIAKDLDVPGQEVIVYTAAREAARQRLFQHVPWLVERLVSAVEEYAAGLEIDTSHIEEVARSLNLESGDPQQIQEALQRLQGEDLSPRVGSRNAAATSRLETLLALVEGWVDVVVGEALDGRIPSAPQLAEAWARRRATGGSAEQAFANVVGIELGAPKVREAAELWRRAENAVGVKRRDEVWDHPDFLPTAEHLDNPAAFIDTLLDDSEDTDLDAEFAKLEQELRENPEFKREDGDGKDDGREDGTEL